MSKLVAKLLETVSSGTPERVDLLRTLYYNCLPYQSNPPTPDEARRYGNKHRFFQRLNSLPRFTVRQGRLAFRGHKASGEPIFQQKRVDLLLGLDFALLSGKKQITHAAVISGDSDLIPAFRVAEEEGVLVWLFHGPRASSTDGSPTFANELWEEADERFEIDRTFMESVARSPQLL
jgi:uncharacterized LabA/DUF88 family protein